MKAMRIGFVLFVLLLTSLACSLPGQTGQEDAQEARQNAPTQEQNAAQPAQDLLPALQIGQNEFQPGETINVQFTAPSGYPADAWVGIIPSGTPHGSKEENDAADLAHESLNGRTQGSLAFQAPQEPGNYDLRMFDADNNGQERASVSFTVIGAPAEQPQAEQPTAEQPQAIQPENTLPASCNGFSLALPTAVASGATCNHVEASPGEVEDAYFMIYPAYDELGLDGYMLQGTFHKPQVIVYPAAEYESMNEAARDIIARLRQLLADKPANPDSIPYLPIFNAAQMMRSNVKYMDFQNGSGVRFLTQYGQAEYPINNGSLFYAFQGLTADGQYYVSATLPVSHPSLPADGSSPPNGDWDAFSANFLNYIQDTEAQLSAQPDDTFTPSLALLDQMMNSLEIQ